MIVAGSIVLGVPYVIGLSLVSTRGSNNGANWLALPMLGPWMAIGARETVCTASTADNSARCAADVLATIGLVFDGIIQTAGGTLLIVGLAVPKKVLVRNDVARLTLTHLGSGYGIAAEGTF